MSVLRSLESKIANVVEGAFGRAFRSELRPVEIARRLAREMENHRTVSISKTYVPNEYTVWLSPEDSERFQGYDDALASELEGYLLEHARLERLALIARPKVNFDVDDRLSLGEFGIQARLVAPASEERDLPAQGEAGHTMVYSAGKLAQATGGQAAVDPRRQQAVVVAEGRRLSVGRSGAVIGRSRDCDIVLSDSNVSRRHAEIELTDAGWTVRDLGSTNGILVNGRRADGSVPLHGGERIDLGTSQLLFELE